MELSKLEQHNLKLKIDDWKTTEPESEFHFRPYQKPEKPTDMVAENPEAEDKEFEVTLLWVHQTHWQQEMLTKYGNTMVLMDAIYKTTLYDVPLFFLTVHTNVG